jgi:hypothetical protein
VIGELSELEEEDVLRGTTDMGPPVNALHTVTMRNLPAPVSGPSQNVFENTFIRFERNGSWDVENGVWTRSWHLQSHKTVLEPGDEIEWRAAETIVDDNDHYRVNLLAQIGGALAQRSIINGIPMPQLLVLMLFFPLMLIVLVVIRGGVRAEIASRDKVAPHLATKKGAGR